MRFLPSLPKKVYISLVGFFKSIDYLELQLIISFGSFQKYLTKTNGHTWGLFWDLQYIF